MYFYTRNSQIHVFAPRFVHESEKKCPNCGTDFIRLYVYSIHLPLSVAADGVIAVTDGDDSSSDLSLLTIWSNFSSIFFILLAIFWLSTSKASILRTNLLTTLKIFDCPMSPKVENDYSNLMIFDILLKVIQVFYRQTLLYVWQCWKEMFWIHWNFSKIWYMGQKTNHSLFESVSHFSHQWQLLDE